MFYAVSLKGVEKADVADDESQEVLWKTLSEMKETGFTHFQQDAVRHFMDI